jgi:hypothetical protein
MDDVTLGERVMLVVYVLPVAHLMKHPVSETILHLMNQIT